VKTVGVWHCCVILITAKLLKLTNQAISICNCFLGCVPPAAGTQQRVTGLPKKLYNWGRWLPLALLRVYEDRIYGGLSFLCVSFMILPELMRWIWVGSSWCVQKVRRGAGKKVELQNAPPQGQEGQSSSSFTSLALLKAKPEDVKR
jgi:hypothetical protein